MKTLDLKFLDHEKRIFICRTRKNDENVQKSSKFIVTRYSRAYITQNLPCIVYCTYLIPLVFKHFFTTLGHSHLGKYISSTICRTPSPKSHQTKISPSVEKKRSACSIPSRRTCGRDRFFSDTATRQERKRRGNPLYAHVHSPTPGEPRPTGCSAVYTLSERAAVSRLGTGGLDASASARCASFLSLSGLYPFPSARIYRVLFLCVQCRIFQDIQHIL